MSVDLYDEYVDAVCAMSPAHFQALEAAGVSAETHSGGASLVGVLKVATDADGFYQPLASGETYFVTPIGVRGEHDIEWREIYDLIAWRLRSPARVFYRRNSGPDLNPEAARRAVHFGEVLRLHKDVLSWLVYGARGTVLLDPRAHAALWYGGIKRILVDDRPTEAKLRAALKPYAPDIRVRAIGGHHVAA